LEEIIQSYTTKYPGLEVYVFYEGERIHDIQHLFKVGKVKHGSAILIAVAGTDIRMSPSCSATSGRARARCSKRSSRRP